MKMNMFFEWLLWQIETHETFEEREHALEVTHKNLYGY